MASTQHKHDKYSLETKTQKPADRNVFKRHVKPQADSGRTRDSITTPVGVNQDCTCTWGAGVVQR